jgi:hypothetical protein
MARPRNKAGKRAYLKRFSSGVVNAGQGIDKRYTDQFKNNHRSMGRVRSGPQIQFQEGGFLLLPPIQHQDPMPPTRPHYDPDGKFIPGISPKRLEVVKRWHEEAIKEYPNAPVIHVLWASMLRGQGYQDYHRIIKFNGRKIKIWMYFSGQNRFYVQETLSSVYVSIIYTSVTRADSAYENQSIAWVERMDKTEQEQPKFKLTPS